MGGVAMIWKSYVDRRAKDAIKHPTTYAYGTLVLGCMVGKLSTKVFTTSATATVYLFFFLFLWLSASCAYFLAHAVRQLRDDNSPASRPSLAEPN